ncbi:hypothetical protein IC620_15270 [Hazenella sp. IB182357]|uniref:Uncharacterized protein n=1 Tax=Polycladospora coralii TaxID=2771432 RepID=A0A926NDA6_9BACL|nr:hypothetical protein [Polycladospora coralii]MBD1373705.1 hypothetical protein [Polycladospora coralii]
MSLGNGYYLCVSTCNTGIYNVERLEALITKLKTFGVNYESAHFLEIRPEESTYERLWDGVDERSDHIFSIDKLRKFFLSSLDLRLNNVLMRLVITFLDEVSYEVSLIMNYSELFESEPSSPRSVEIATRIEGLGLFLFEELDPIYGYIGIERGVYGIKDINEGSGIIENDRLYFNHKIYDKIKECIDIQKTYSFCHRNKLGGCYVRKTDVNDYTLDYKDNEIALLTNIFKSVLI